MGSKRDRGRLCTHPIFKCLEKLAAQGEVIFQDDTLQRVLALIEENQNAVAQARAQGKAKTDERTGMQTTALIVQVGERRICLYYTGRRHAGENLDALLTKREPGQSKPLVMSDALSRNNAPEDALIRCHCLAHGRRKFSELDEVFPTESAVVVNALKDVFDHDEYARVNQLTAQHRLAYHQRTSGPIMETLTRWLEQQTAQRLVEPNSSLGKADRLYGGALGDAHAVFARAGRAAGEQPGGARVETRDSAAQELLVPCHRA